jgi:hypothetical protein
MIAGSSAEAWLREKLRKIEALFAGAATRGERAAADADRIRARLGMPPAARLRRRSNSRSRLVAPALHRAMSSVWDQPVSISPDAQANRYHQRAAELYRAGPTEKLIREEVHGETADAEERDEPKRTGR